METKLAITMKLGEARREVQEHYVLEVRVVVKDRARSRRTNSSMKSRGRRAISKGVGREDQQKEIVVFSTGCSAG